MPLYTANYCAYSEQGDFNRPAKTVGELEHEDRLPALKQAAKNTGLAHISYGVPIYRSLKLTRGQAENDSRNFLFYTGENLPLEYVNNKHA